MSTGSELIFKGVYILLLQVQFTRKIFAVDARAKVSSFPLQGASNHKRTEGEGE